MTPQETFDYVCHKLLLQGERSVDENGDCAYRGPRGLKCAAGWLIPDEKYYADFEGAAAMDIDFPFDQTDLVQALQEAHDRAVKDFRQDFRSYAYLVAQNHGLSSEVLTQ